VLEKVHDVDFLILPPQSESVGSISLEEHSPVFHSTFEGHQLLLQDLPHTTMPMPPARLLQMNAPVLPPLDLSELKSPTGNAKPPGGAPRMTMRISGPLQLRALTQAPDLSQITLNDPTTCRFQLGVNSDGIVNVALPVASSESVETMQKLGNLLQEIRFAPASVKGSAPVWGTAIFEWSSAAP
jgi:hypothetical protein